MCYNPDCCVRKRGQTVIKLQNVKDIGKLIRSERKAQGLTQTRLAEMSNVGLSYITNLENGKDTAEIGKALHVMRMLGIDLFGVKRGA